MMLASFLLLLDLYDLSSLDSLQQSGPGQCRPFQVSWGGTGHREPAAAKPPGAIRSRRGGGRRQGLCWPCWRQV